MPIDCEIIFQTFNLAVIQELILDIQQILSHCQRTALGKFQIITVITICIGISVNDNFCQIRHMFLLQKDFAVDGEHGLQSCLAFICEFCLVVCKHNIGIQCQGTCLGININIDIIFGKFIFQRLYYFRLDTDNLIDLSLLIRKKSCFFIQV